jgi:UDP-N-acetyl-D-glucosamine dehydrogenase
MASVTDLGPNLLEKIRNRSARVVVVGAGHVGLPTACALAEAGFDVTALDDAPLRVAQVAAGRSYVPDVADARVCRLVDAGVLRATADRAALASADVVLICVPTPLAAEGEPDVSHIEAATAGILEHQHAGMLVVLESTTYPGLTREWLVPRLSERFALGRELFVAFSPQRLDPGNPTFGLRNTPKLVAGATAECLAVASAFYGTIVETIVPVPSLDTAELAKLFENVFRAVNIGLVNELALVCRHLGLDVFEVIDAATTKPFGFMPFRPGPGIGGHCIAVDPVYLDSHLRKLGLSSRFIELAEDVNRAMRTHVASRVAEELSARRRSLEGARLLVYGVAYKPDVRDARESPALGVIEALRTRGATVEFMDPHVPALELGRSVLASIKPDASFEPYDAVILVTPHSALDRARLLSEAQLVLDTRGALRGLPAPPGRVVGL